MSEAKSSYARLLEKYDALRNEKAAYVAFMSVAIRECRLAEDEAQEFMDRDGDVKEAYARMRDFCNELKAYATWAQKQAELAKGGV